MADCDPASPIDGHIQADVDAGVGVLHPAVARQAGHAAWTADPAIATLLDILDDLDAVGARLETLHHARPDLGAGAVRGEVGRVVRLYERCPARDFAQGWRVRANGGACAALWQLLAARRDAWIDARLEAEGFAPFRPGRARDARTAALVAQALPLDRLWQAHASR